jgi:hypothetical protein
MNLCLLLSLKWTNPVVVIFVQYQGNCCVSVRCFEWKEFHRSPTAAVPPSSQCITVPSLGACGVRHIVKVQDRLPHLLHLKGKKHSLTILCGSNTRKKVIKVGGIGHDSYLFSCRCTSSPSSLVLYSTVFCGLRTP